MIDYSASISSHLPPPRIYRIITEEMSKWWTPMSAKFLRPGDVARTNFGAQSYWVFKANVLKEYDFIELICCEANHIHQGLSENIRQEWLNTKLQFKISGEGNNTIIDFTHAGLVPELECFEVCREGWDHFFAGCLKKYLDSAT